MIQIFKIAQTAQPLENSYPEKDILIALLAGPVYPGAQEISQQGTTCQQQKETGFSPGIKEIASDQNQQVLSLNAFVEHEPV